MYRIENYSVSFIPFMQKNGLGDETNLVKLLDLLYNNCPENCKIAIGVGAPEEILEQLYDRQKLVEDPELDDAIFKKAADLEKEYLEFTKGPDRELYFSVFIIYYTLAKV